MRIRFAMLAVALVSMLVPDTADAFCGFYINGAGSKMFNNATMVVMMREGTRTVLSMSNNYQGPPEDFAMVVPVPVVLKEGDVKTLDPGLFDAVDKLAAPRLVEYWERDPCYVPPPPRKHPARKMKSGAPSGMAKPMEGKKDYGVTIEATFTVGEYEVVILSAKFSTGLDSWLRDSGYKIPAGAEPILRPYVTSGMKFFVAKVDIKKVKKVGDKTMLSPLRFHYDTEEFSLPIRLGLINSPGVQDLIVHILAPKTRYEVANYDNVFIPTNLNVRNPVRHSFGSFYAALFDATLKKHPGSVVTEYSWDAGSCDPCPTPPLNGGQLMSLGGDVMETKPTSWGGGFVLTRLHTRYTKGAVGEDLIFRKAEPVVGGRESRTGGRLETGAEKGTVNNFQARYAIRHWWRGEIKCDKPKRGVWGGPWAWVKEKPASAVARDLAFVKRKKGTLKRFLRSPIPELGIIREPKAPKPAE